MFYSYLHCRPDGTPFYVGKGTRERIGFVRRKHNKWHCRIVDKYGAENILTVSMECSSEEISFSLEVGLIKRLRVMGVNLVNQTDGGDGRSGGEVAPEVRMRISQKLKGTQNFLGKHHSPETRAKISQSLFGNKRGCGKIFSEEHREKLRAAGTGRKFSEESKNKIAQKLVGNKNSLGKKWINDGVRNRKINLADAVPVGWVYGKIPRVTQYDS